jgi:hypothetical protein
MLAVPGGNLPRAEQQDAHTKTDARQQTVTEVGLEDILLRLNNPMLCNAGNLVCRA